MTTHNTHGHTGFSCDSCSMTFDDDEAGTFHEAWKAARAAGWRSEKTRDGWEHSCPDCARAAR